MSKRYVLSEEAYKRLRNIASNHDFPETEDERQQWYENAVTCGNGSDSYQYGYDDGTAELAASILDSITEE